jgi:hypothetical protein
MESQLTDSPRRGYDAPTNLLVVLDHREARVYKTASHGETSQRIRPYNPHGFGRHLRYVPELSNDRDKRERFSFYQSIVKTLDAADQILLFGRGTGASSAMAQLLSKLKQQYPALANRVLGSVVVTQQRLSRSQLLGMAVKFHEEKKSP